jgi:hypothetical protein
MRTLLYNLKEKYKNKLKNHKVFNEGYQEFLKTGKTSQEAYNSLLNLYCSTNGKFNEKIHKKIISNNLPKKINQPLEGIIGKIKNEEFNYYNHELNKFGYVNFNKKISQELVNSIYNYALNAEALTAPLYDKKIIYNPTNPISEIYRFTQKDLVNNKDIQQLIMDPVLINIARNYLQCEPIFDFPAMWWTNTFLKEASAEAAQLYHFDMDRIKWLKIFVYLNDVTNDNGPHQLIKGSHLPGAKPKELLNRGYERIPDQDINKYYKPEDVIVVLGQAGSVFAEDTKCWHKGTPLKSGHRLVLEFEYTSSLFGANYPKFEIENFSEEFKQFCTQNPVYATHFIFKN